MLSRYIRSWGGYKLHIGSNLPPKDNLWKEDKSSAPKASFIWRFHCRNSTCRTRPLHFLPTACLFTLLYCWWWTLVATPRKKAGGCHSHRLYSYSCDRTQSTVNGQTIRISAVNGQSGVGQRSNPSAEWTRLVLQFAPNLAVGLHMRGMLIF